MTDSALREKVLSVGLGAGLDRMGICAADPFPGVRETLVERRSNGLSGGLGFTFSRPDEAADVRKTFPWARSLVVGVASYLPAAGDPGARGPGAGRVARFATEDHYRPLRSALAEVAGVLHRAGHRAEILVDDSRLVDRAAAVRAGVGWWGKNGMVLAPSIGPWFLIGSLAIDVELETDRPMIRDCGTCEACLPACPTGALVAPGVLDARRCLAALLQQKAPIPLEFRRAVGDRIYGCDDCLEACPPGSRLRADSVARRGRHDAGRLLLLEDDELLDRFEHFYVPGRDAKYLRRNLLVVLGNTGGDVQVLIRFLADPDPLLRGHAAWALGEVGGSEASAALGAALSRERDPAVRAEIEDALGQSEAAPIGR
jgi:epoxyqueuosine reductase